MRTTSSAQQRAEALALWAAWASYERLNRRAAEQYRQMPLAFGNAKAKKTCACGAKTVADVCRKCRSKGRK